MYIFIVINLLKTIRLNDFKSFNYRKYDEPNTNWLLQKINLRKKKKKKHLTLGTRFL